MIRDRCEKCAGFGETHGPKCIVRRFIFNREREKPRLSRLEALEFAVLALQAYQDRVKDNSMSCKIIPFVLVKPKLKGKKMSLPVQSASPNGGIDLEKLKDPFKETEVEFRLSQCGESGDRVWARCLAYIDARAIMNRLDEVCGPSNWKVSYEFVGNKGVICNLSIQVGGGWITKQDGAEMTEIESFKGGMSSALKRAGSVWGMGRYLYALEAEFIPQSNIFDEKRPGTYQGKTKNGRVFYWLPPALPSWALPKQDIAQNVTSSIEFSDANEDWQSDSNPIEPIPRAHNIPNGLDIKRPTEKQYNRMRAIQNKNKVSDSELKEFILKTYSIRSTRDLNVMQYNELCNKMDQGILNQKKKNAHGCKECT